ncbi:MAG TPA: ABC transporter substrate-binding protein [Herpetosiphonaceae bacterium]|nr:ABC transporter substrate-binding protein [Herpetosiphonaceae bacterium]
MTNDGSRQFSRRTFIKTIAATTGLLAIPAALPDSAAAAGKAPVASTGRIYALPSVGVLAPQSSAYPALSGNFINGLNLALYGQGRAGVGKGAVATAATSISATRASLDTMLARARVDVVVGVLRPTDELQQALAAQGRALLATSFEATVPSGQPAGALQHDLPYWQAAWALGNWAARNIGKRAAILHSFHESGYDASFAFYAGFLAGGGQECGMTVTHSPSASRKLDAVVGEVAALKPDLVYLGYGATDGAETLAALRASGLGKLPTLASGAMLEAASLRQLGPAALGLRSAMPWNSDVASQASQDFVQAYRRVARSEPDHWSLLGFEIGSLLGVASQALKGNWGDPAAVQAALRGAQFAGPRGLVGPQVAGGGFVIREVRSSGANLINASIASVSAAPLADPRIAELMAGVRSGWSLPYLTV